LKRTPLFRKRLHGDARSCVSFGIPVAVANFETDPENAILELSRGREIPVRLDSGERHARCFRACCVLGTAATDGNEQHADHRRDPPSPHPAATAASAVPVLRMTSD